MIKTFITAISMQTQGGLEKGMYQPRDFVLKHNVSTSFPIIPVITEQTQDDRERVKVIALRTENPDTKDNYDAFVEQLGEMGIAEKSISVIRVPEDQSRQIGVDTFLKLLDEIPEDSLVYADITFGTKPIAMYILYAAIFVEKMKDSEVEGIYYGELPRAEGKSDWARASLYELSILKTIGGVIEQLNVLQIKDKRGALQQLLEQ